MLNELFNAELRKMPKALSEVAFYLSQGFSNQQISDWRGTSVHTTRLYLQDIRERLGFDGSRLNLMFAILKAIE